MASLGHVAIGMAAARLGLRASATPQRLWPVMLCLSLLSLLPDADVIAFSLGIPYAAPFGHRGASHALLAAAVLALLPSLLLARLLAVTTLRAWALAALVLASHGLLDSLTDGGLGIALLWPWSEQRFFAPWRPIPVAPIGLGFLGPVGLRVALTELVLFAPVLLYALWPRSRRGMMQHAPPAS